MKFYLCPGSTAEVEANVPCIYLLAMDNHRLSPDNVTDMFLLSSMEQIHLWMAGC
jgi:hypothetical protein